MSRKQFGQDFTPYSVEGQNTGLVDETVCHDWLP